MSCSCSCKQTLTHTPVSNLSELVGSPNCPSLESLFWFVICSLSGVSRHLCSIFPGKVSCSTALYIIRWLMASLASTHQMPLSSLALKTNSILWNWQVPFRGWNTSWLRTAGRVLSLMLGIRKGQQASCGLAYKSRAVFNENHWHFMCLWWLKDDA